MQRYKRFLIASVRNLQILFVSLECEILKREIMAPVSLNLKLDYSQNELISEFNKDKLKYFQNLLSIGCLL